MKTVDGITNIVESLNNTTNTFKSLNNITDNSQFLDNITQTDTFFDNITDKFESLHNITDTISENNSSLTARNRQSKLFEEYHDNYEENRVTEFRPSSQVDYNEPTDQFDQNGNSPWAPAPSSNIDQNYIENEDDEYYFDENDITDVDKEAEPREDDDESIRVAVWVDPSVKTNMGGLMNGIRKFVQGQGSNQRPRKQKKPSSSYGPPSSSNSNKLKDFVKNILPKNNNNNNNYQNSGGGGGKGKNQGFRLPELFKGKGQNSQYGQASTTRRPQKLPSLPKLPKFPNLFKGKGSTTRKPSTDYGAPPAPSSGYGIPTRTPNAGRPKKKKKPRTRKPVVNSNQLPSTPPDFVFGTPIRLLYEAWEI